MIEAGSRDAMESMRAMAVRTPAPIEINPLQPVELARPRPRTGELLVRVRVCGVCRTDLHVAEGDLPPKQELIIPGHEVVGEVVELGDHCSRFRPGDRVGIAWLRETCGRCKYCQLGRENLCPNARFTGWDENGGYAEWATVREDFAYPLPSTIPDEQAAPLLCAGIIGQSSVPRYSREPLSGCTGLAVLRIWPYRCSVIGNAECL